MCGLFGFSSYGDKPVEGLSVLTNSLAEESAVRGTDATGIAYCGNGIQIQKEARSAYAMNLRHPVNIHALIGYTRHSTHGSAKKNFNNHPFVGKVSGGCFALTHNGILMNAESLREAYSLPQTKIETDSYVAVQLIERERRLDFDSIRRMAEAVKGNFSFAILDDEDALYLVKGDNPLSLLHFPGKKLYVYASTDGILFKALVDSPLFEMLKKGEYEEIPLEDGMILKIASDGSLSDEHFRLENFLCRAWWNYEDALPILYHMAMFNGIAPDEIDALLDEGFTEEEIEEYLYER